MPRVAVAHCRTGVSMAQSQFPVVGGAGASLGLLEVDLGEAGVDAQCVRAGVPKHGLEFEYVAAGPHVIALEFKHDLP